VESELPNLLTVRSRLSIEDFRGDFDALATVMQRSWAENKTQPLLYAAEMLASPPLSMMARES
jgi:hypothetical protein